MKRKKEIKYSNLKFIITLLFGMICAIIPLVLFGSNAIIFSMGTGLAGTSLCLIIFF